LNIDGKTENNEIDEFCQTKDKTNYRPL